MHAKNPPPRVKRKDKWEKKKYWKAKETLREPDLIRKEKRERNGEN